MSHWTSGTVSAAYAAFRPRYPPELFRAVAQRCTSRALCVDVGCGTGQAVQGLAELFDRVVGVDPSESQVKHATPVRNATYVVGGAESFAKSIAPHSADCVTVAQAMHWFNLPVFFEQLDLALRPEGVCAFWIYPTCRITSHPAIHDALQTMDAFLLREKYWPAERNHIDNHYRDIIPQFTKRGWKVERATFPVEKSVHLDDFVQYLSTWSGINRHKVRQPQRDLLEEFRTEARKHLLNDASPITVVFDMETFFATRYVPAAKL